jgi:glyoxylase-like metal-dependent hydrolase (beta-lactamase superfamily II)
MNPILIELMPDVPGFDHFIGSWVCTGRQNVLVDVGPSNAAARLVTGLKTMGVERVDTVLLTHIHIDHAGGLGTLMEHYPMAKIICHEMGIRHLVDPDKLWAGSRKVLGRVAETYGPLKPLDREVLVSHRDAQIEGLEIIETPGHAPHHLSFCYQGILFPGEAGGNYFSSGDTDYMRPATPPVFFLETSLNSVDRLLSLGDMPIFYPHFGRAERAELLLKRHREQLLRWEEIISQEAGAGESQLVERCLDRLLGVDTELRAFAAMTTETRERERYFMTNSIAGFLGYLKEKK